jgi:alpha-amylase/alpha-mannosidase (GH57 family)
MSANDKQIAGRHYQTTGGVQHWDYCDANDVPYLESACTKYVLRWREKNGLQDLLKAQHYLQKRIENQLAGTGAPRGGRLSFGEYIKFVNGSGLTERELELEIITNVMHWSNPEELETAWLALEELIRLAEIEGDATPAYVNQD